NLGEIGALPRVSFPTLRKKLVDSIEALGGPVETGEPGPRGRRKQILEQVRLGRLSVDEALSQLRELGEEPE
ncbi:MAG: hypothetical protein DIU69_01200, partial [Bacillota bacterium]